MKPCDCLTVGQFLLYSQLSSLASAVLFAFLSVPLAVLVGRSAWLRKLLSREP